MEEPHDELIYLDYNATTPLLPEVVDAMLPYLREHFGNPSSGHSPGRRAHEAIERAREQVADLLGCAPAEVVFTSGGTEASNLAIRGVLEATSERVGVVTSVIEHPATSAPCDWLKRQGHPVARLSVSAHGQIRLEEAERAIDSNTALVSLMHANNETGALQPIAALAELARRVGALLHTDAAQSVGKLPVDVDALGVDLLTVAGHKLYAPKGVGALYVRQGTPLAPLVRGAGHERGLRPGTENVASIVGLGEACAIAQRDLEDVRARMTRLRDELWELLVRAIPGIVCHGPPHQRLPQHAPHPRPRDLRGRAPGRCPRARRLDWLGLPRRADACLASHPRHGSLSRGRPRLGAIEPGAPHHPRADRARRARARQSLRPAPDLSGGGASRAGARASARLLRRGLRVELGLRAGAGW